MEYYIFSEIPSNDSTFNFEFKQPFLNEKNIYRVKGLTANFSIDANPHSYTNTELIGNFTRVPTDQLSFMLSAIVIGKYK